MTDSKSNRKRRSVIVVVLLLPAIIFLWIFGWSLYWIGRQRASRNPQPPSSSKKEDRVSLIPMTVEDTLEIEN